MIGLLNKGLAYALAVILLFAAGLTLGYRLARSRYQAVLATEQQKLTAFNWKPSMIKREPNFQQRLLDFLSEKPAKPIRSDRPAVKRLSSGCAGGSGDGTVHYRNRGAP